MGNSDEKTENSDEKKKNNNSSKENRKKGKKHILWKKLEKNIAPNVI